MGPVRGQGQRVVNTHHSQNGEDVHQGRHLHRHAHQPRVHDRGVTSSASDLGGGEHPQKTCALSLLIDGATVRTVTGRNSNVMDLHNWDVAEFAGKTARLQAVDVVSGGWGQVSLDDIVFCDSPRKGPWQAQDQPDYGTLSLGMLTQVLN